MVQECNAEASRLEFTDDIEPKPGTLIPSVTCSAVAEEANTGKPRHGLVSGVQHRQVHHDVGDEKASD